MCDWCFGKCVFEPPFQKHHVWFQEPVFFKVLRNVIKRYCQDVVVFVMGVDVDFYIRVLRKNPSFVYIDSDLVNCIVGDNTVSNEYQNNWLKRTYEYAYLGLKTAGGL